MLHIYQAPTTDPARVTLLASAETWAALLARLQQQRAAETARAVQRALRLAGPGPVQRIALPHEHARIVVAAAQGSN